MKQVVQIPRTGEVQVLDVPPPSLKPGGALILTHASVLSPGTERSKIALGSANLVSKARARPDLVRQVIEKTREDGVRETYRTVVDRLATAAPLGYSACGTVIEVASDCTGIHVGDLVACAGAGYANHAEVNFVPRNLLARVPDGVAAEQAAYATIGAIALHAVRRADISIGDRVAVIGLGLVGLLVVQLVQVAGGRVLATDVAPEACEDARRLGAERAVRRSDSVEAVAEGFTDGHGVDAVIVSAATRSSDPIELATSLCRDRGRVVVVGDVGMTVPREPFYAKELELRLSRSYGPGRYDPAYEERGNDYPIGYVRWPERQNLIEFLRAVSEKLVDVDSLTTHRFPVDRAADAYGLITRPREDADGRRPLGVLLEYASGEGATIPRTVALRRAPSPNRDVVRLGVVGAGNFANRVLLPTLAKDPRARFVGVCTGSGLTARQVAERFAFARATSEADELIADPEVDAIVIATRHDLHAALSARALRAGKAVFCEKPLALNWPELEDIADAAAVGSTPLFVGFNRRFSPLVVELRGQLAEGVPRAVVCRVNAGPLPANHWLRDPTVGGGRIVGELCHFLDLACHLAEEPPRQVSAKRLGASDATEIDDSVFVHVDFADGSIASLQYLSNGDPAFPKERIEVFCAGAVFVLDDFRTLEVTRARRRRVTKAKHQQKGHREELHAFLDAVTGKPIDVDQSEVFWSSALTLQVQTALARGAPTRVSLPQALGGAGAMNPCSLEASVRD